jgi:flagellar hook-basal body complex protein FliE
MRILQANPFTFTQTPQVAEKTNAKEQWAQFARKLNDAVDEVDCLDKNSQRLTQDLVLGRVDNIHDVMIAAEKARTAMNLTLEVRGKVIESYKEIMRMQF